MKPPVKALFWGCQLLKSYHFTFQAAFTLRNDSRSIGFPTCFGLFSGLKLGCTFRRDIITLAPKQSTILPAVPYCNTKSSFKTCWNIEPNGNWIPGSKNQSSGGFLWGVSGTELTTLYQRPVKHFQVCGQTYARQFSTHKWTWTNRWNVHLYRFQPRCCPYLQSLASLDHLDAWHLPNFGNSTAEWIGVDPLTMENHNNNKNDAVKNT